MSKLVIKVNPDGHCVFNSVLVAYVSVFGNYPANDHGEPIKNYRGLRRFVQSGFDSEESRQLLKSVLVNAVKEKNFGGLKELRSALEKQDPNRILITKDIIEDYIRGIVEGDIWGGGQELSILSTKLDVEIKWRGDFLPYNSNAQSRRSIEIQFVRGDHYNAVIT